MLRKAESLLEKC